ncbi:MarR family transcriptional regulator [Pseudooceanicola sediminis]|uniref:MarR family transcriptional regulator n=1 Tax=Pseudooceanicola sediminis TaxID=2211117 RepID=A0A399J3B9_9RHOB|nr:MarR family winged helix-turn-helix transcriptional regulator [Pseudooceanicola sediminis]KAA2314331.1 winged helix-turn-helix transcriptional regulator [Puniceibacterium sp. HSS470]RII39815.1 MarR family transcriptional regulator [Pseudooceanicola sediminis]|tara:strand:+ start:83683 stop:84126 length:444 start_codon:yes stop_codon:yes gene_type:complete
MNSIGLMLYEAATLLKREFERSAKPHRLTLMQWRVLASLAERDGVTQTDLMADLRTGAMTISDVVERLEQVGLVTREVDASDNRAKRVCITAKGSALRAEMRVLAEQVYARTLEGIDPEERAVTERVLTRIAENLQDRKAPKKEMKT